MRAGSDKVAFVAVFLVTILCSMLLFTVMTPMTIPVSWHWYLHEGFTDVNLQRLTFPYPMGGPLLPLWIEHWGPERIVPLRIVIWQNVLYTILYSGLLLGVILSHIKEWRPRLLAAFIAFCSPLWWSAALSEVTSAFISLVLILAWLLASWYKSVPNLRLLQQVLYLYCAVLLGVGCYFSRKEVVVLLLVILAEAFIQRSSVHFPSYLLSIFQRILSYLSALRGMTFCIIFFLVLHILRQYAPPFLEQVNAPGQILYFIYAGISLYSITFLSPFFLSAFWGIGGTVFMVLGLYRTIRLSKFMGFWAVATIVLYSGYVASGHLGMAPFEIWRYLTILFVPQVILIMIGIESYFTSCFQYKKNSFTLFMLFALLCIPPFFHIYCFHITQYMSFGIGWIVTALLVRLLARMSIDGNTITRQTFVVAGRQFVKASLALHLLILGWVGLVFTFPSLNGISFSSGRLGWLFADLFRLLGHLIFFRGGFQEHMIALVFWSSILWILSRLHPADSDILSSTRLHERELLFTFAMTTIIVGSLRPTSWLPGWKPFAEVINGTYSYQDMDMQQERRFLLEWQETFPKKPLFIPVTLSYSSSGQLFVYRIEGHKVTSTREVLLPYHVLLSSLCDNPPCYLSIGLSRYVTPEIHDNILLSKDLRVTECYQSISRNFSPQHNVYAPDINLCVYRWEPYEALPSLDE